LLKKKKWKAMEQWRVGLAFISMLQIHISIDQEGTTWSDEGLV
jgi:hypothetical protein